MSLSFVPYFFGTFLELAHHTGVGRWIQITCGFSTERQKLPIVRWNVQSFLVPVQISFSEDGSTGHGVEQQQPAFAPDVIRQPTGSPQPLD